MSQNTDFAKCAVKTSALTKQKYNRQKIRGLPDLKKGESHSDVVDVQNYLKRYGYLPLDSSCDPCMLDAPTSQAIARFQKRSNIDSSGNLDDATKQEMTISRCGLPDILDPLAFSIAGPWTRRNLTYAFGNLSSRMTRDVARNAIRRALNTWTQAGVGLNFTEVMANENPDIFIEWRPANDPDHSMVGGVLAHADFPPGYSIIVDGPPLPLHYDDQEHVWVDQAVINGYDIETVALHEVGHCLGLYHSDVQGSVMFRSVSASLTKRSLQPDNLAGIRALYDPPIFQSFLVQTGTALHETDDTFDCTMTDWNGDGRPDLVAIKKSKTGTNSTEVHIFSAVSNFKKVLVQTGTALHETDDTFDFTMTDWNGDGRPDLLAIKKSKTGTNSTEVHILSS
ncbi:hypothetical protein CNMCM5793_006046 [Aspergillus hiratsukae]|uniref:Peptidase metallopeptidase domain-containing protein n=1 Tax=Aspergillus hiratsukae TaxID=1194566 RepID=A0A8H6PHF9_9EURO|nr:hypothetical protein CNMCM5793_006046 [Aspergillus hiratsukae]